MADGIRGLKDFQESERTWHENHWAKETALHSRIESRHREINAKLQMVVKGGALPKPVAVAAGRRY
jgi:hypothetical protein